MFLPIQLVFNTVIYNTSTTTTSKIIYNVKKKYLTLVYATRVENKNISEFKFNNTCTCSTVQSIGTIQINRFAGTGSWYTTVRTLPSVLP